MALTIDGTSLMDITLDGVNMKYVNLDNVLVFTRVDMPAFTKQPNGGSISSGASFTSSVVVSSGDGTLSYQWYLNNSAVSGATGASYTFSGLAEGSHTIRCEAWNERGRVVSNNATITVAAAWTHTMTVATYGNTKGYNRSNLGSHFGSINTTSISGIAGTILVFTANSLAVNHLDNGITLKGGTIGKSIRISSPAGSEVTTAGEDYFLGGALYQYNANVIRSYILSNTTAYFKFSYA